MIAHFYKYAKTPDLMLDLYKLALEDCMADKQFKNLVVFNLARSEDYYDSALDILHGLNEKPDLFMYNSGIIACETGGDWEQVRLSMDCSVLWIVRQKRCNFLGGFSWIHIHR